MEKRTMAKILIKSYINKDKEVFTDTASRLLDCTPENVLSLLDCLNTYSIRLNHYVQHG